MLLVTIVLSLLGMLNDYTDNFINSIIKLTIMPVQSLILRLVSNLNCYTGAFINNILMLKIMPMPILTL